MAFLFFAALLGLIPAFIAQSKGRSFGAWWLYGFLIFIVAIIHVLIIPSKVKEKTYKNDELRYCPCCAEPIKKQASKCKHCGSEIDPLPMSIAVSESDDNNGTKIAWNRALVLVLSLLVSYLIIRFFGGVL